MILTHLILGPQVEKHSRAQMKALTLGGEKRYHGDMCEPGLGEFYLVASFIYEVGDDISVQKGLFVATEWSEKAVRLGTEVVGMGENACMG